MDLFRIALSNRRSFVETCHKSLLRLLTRGVDGLAVLLYVQRDAYFDTAMKMSSIRKIENLNRK